jgi:signal transduction histidine kinase
MIFIRFGATDPILGEASQLAHVLLNLLVNAVQSIGPGHPEQNEIRVSTWMAGSGSAVIEVRDSGPGIPPEISDRIFEPFYTTKPVGEGSTFRVIVPATRPAPISNGSLGG